MKKVAFVFGLVLVALLLSMASAETAPTYQGCAKEGVRTPSECSSPCYFVKQISQPAGSCVYGVVVLPDGISEVAPTGAYSDPLTTSELIQVLGAPAGNDQEIAATVPESEKVAPAQKPALQKELRANYTPIKQKTKVTNFDAIIEKCAAKYGIPADRIRAHMKVESGGNPSIRGTSGEYGLMQLMPCTAKGLGIASNPICVKCRDDAPSCNACSRDCKVSGFVPGSQDEKNAWDPEKNICAGALLLKQLYERFHDWKCVAIGYNAGAGTASRTGCNAVPAYVAKVESAYAYFTQGTA